MEKHKCKNCGTEFTSREQYEDGDADVREETTCDTIEGQYIEWQQIRCPKCFDVVQEYGR